MNVLHIIIALWTLAGLITVHRLGMINSSLGRDLFIFIAWPLVIERELSRRRTSAERKLISRLRTRLIAAEDAHETLATAVHGLERIEIEHKYYLSASDVLSLVRLGVYHV